MGLSDEIVLFSCENVLDLLFFSDYKYIIVL